MKNASIVILKGLIPTADEYDPRRIWLFRALTEVALLEFADGKRNPLATALGLYRDQEDYGPYLLSLLLGLYEDFSANPEDFEPYDRGMLRSAAGCSPEFAARVQERLLKIRVGAHQQIA